MGGALEGIRIVECIQGGQSGAGCMLADMGADVIKIEEPQRGDMQRETTHTKGVPTLLPGGRHTSIETLNRNKRGIAVDITRDKGKEIVYRLIKKSDVFIQNFRQGVAERQGLGYEKLSEINPRLIYASGTGYGPLGPDSARPAIDLVSQARSGVMMSVGPPDAPPFEVPLALNDMVGNLTLAYGILVALVARERTGIGQRVDSSLIGSMINVMRLGVNAYLLTGIAPKRFSRQEAPNPLWICYRCGDEKWLQLGLSHSDRYWPHFCQVVGIEALQKDSRFENEKARAQNRQELIALLDEVFTTKDREEWVRRLREKDLIVDVINSLEDLNKDPQVLANDYIAKFNHPDLGPIEMVGIPVKLSKTPGSIRSPAPQLGEHTEGVLLEIGGYTPEEITQLEKEGVIRVPTRVSNMA